MPASLYSRALVFVCVRASAYLSVRACAQLQSSVACQVLLPSSPPSPPPLPPIFWRMRRPCVLHWLLPNSGILPVTKHWDTACYQTLGYCLLPNSGILDVTKQWDTACYQTVGYCLLPNSGILPVTKQWDTACYQTVGYCLYIWSTGDNRLPQPLHKMPPRQSNNLKSSG